MMHTSLILLTTIFYSTIVAIDPELEDEQYRAYYYMIHLNTKFVEQMNAVRNALWTYETNLTLPNINEKFIAQKKYAQERRDDWLETRQFRWNLYNSADLRRNFKFHSAIGKEALPADEYKMLNEILHEVGATFHFVPKICDYYNRSRCNLASETGTITKIMSTSRNADELQHIWLQWRYSVSYWSKNMFEEFVNITNKAARLNNFKDHSQYWLDAFGVNNIKDQLRNAWIRIEPLYLQLHAYVRYKLRQRYGDIVPEKGPIPVYLLGSTANNDWNVLNFTLPYPDVPETNITDEMIRQGYTPLTIFQKADNFLHSLNLTTMPASFWTKSMLQTPKDRLVRCNSGAWDFFNGDVRINQCIQVNEDHLRMAHNTIAHCEYFLQYSNISVIYRGPAAPGFAEAIGGMLSLSVHSPKYLNNIGLLNQTEFEERTTINNLYKMSLRNITFLPFAYAMELWSRDVFSGEIPKSQWNCKWWELRYEHEGVKPPVNRSNSQFDPSAQRETLADIPYLKHFIAVVLEFQLHHALCLRIGEYVPGDPKKPLHKCSIYGSAKAGSALRDFLQLGSSQPWPESLKTLTGQGFIDASGLLAYFQPLMNWLSNENWKNSIRVGWLQNEGVCLPTNN